MSLIKINWNPPQSQLRSFNIICPIACLALSALLYAFKGLDIRWALTITAAGLAVFCAGLISLKITKAVFLGLTVLTLPIGYAVSFVLMAIFYYLILTPLGLVFRLIGRDVLRRRFDRSAKSYWISRDPSRSLESYFHQS